MSHGGCGKNFDPQLELVASAAPVVLAGDYNVVPTAADAINSAADLVPLALSLVCFPNSELSPFTG